MPCAADTIDTVPSRSRRRPADARPPPVSSHQAGPCGSCGPCHSGRARTGPRGLNAFSAAFALAFTGALLWLGGATLWRLLAWWRTPEPLPIPLAPAPRTRAAVVGRLALEILLFRSLARASVPTWLAAMLFHYGLLVVLLVHLRFLFPLLPAWFVPLLRMSGWATLALLVGLLVLLARRVLVDRVRWISAPSDYLHLALLLAIALTGVALKRLWPVELHQVGAFVRGVLGVDWQGLPAHAGLVAHLLGVLLLLVVFPISKLVHAVGIGLAPTFRQRDPHPSRDARPPTGPSEGSSTGPPSGPSTGSSA